MEKEIEISGVRIHYREEGDPSSPLVVLLHGWGANLDLFAGIFALLAPKYHVAAMDMPGFGKSGEPDHAYDLDDFADFVETFVQTLFPGEREVILLGHSHGGRTIIRLLARGRAPFACPKAILVDSAGIVPEKTPAQKRRVRTYHFLKQTLVKTGLASRHPQTLDALQKKFGSADYSAASPLMRASMVKVVNTDLRQEMPQLTMPVLLIWGSADTATPLSDGQTMEKLMPEAGLAVIQGAGHFSFLDQPAVFARILGSFLHVG
ncbi:MAG: alpha/beta hydrolase [Eubacteriales bacterium]|nr:alpha/beta hydrolase [Eubacteriales bacterium]